MLLEIANMIAGVPDEMEEWEDDEEQDEDEDDDDGESNRLKVYKDYGTGFGQKTNGVMASSQNEFMLALINAAANSPDGKQIEQLKETIKTLRSEKLGFGLIFY